MLRWNTTDGVWFHAVARMVSGICLKLWCSVPLDSYQVSGPYDEM